MRKNILFITSCLLATTTFAENINTLPKDTTKVIDIEEVVVIASPRAQDILFVAICRALGVPARLNPIDSQPEYYSNGAFLPPALGFSPHPPVSVYGTGPCYTIAAFLDRKGPQLRYFVSLRITPSSYAGRIFQSCDYFACTGLSIPGSASLPVSPQF